jgi:O-antigen biosynthesis protein WbqV
MIRLSGRKPGTDIEIKITEVRPGEKLAEELKALDEAEAPTVHPSISRVTPIAIDPEHLEQGVLRLEHLAHELEAEQCGAELRALATVERPTAEQSK